jgi:anti-sigma factor RsiW
MAKPIARHHAEWLSLVEVSGPFLTLPVLQRAFPQGLEDTDPESAAITSRAIQATLSRSTSACSSLRSLSASWAAVILGPSAIVAFSFVDPWTDRRS